MKTKILFGVLFVSFVLLLIPSVPALQLITIDKANESLENFKIDFSKDLKKISKEEPPEWFLFFYTIIMLSLMVRFEILTPLAVKDFGGYFGGVEINSYFFALILMTLVYRFAFWYNFFDKISEKNNWDFP